MQTTRYGSMDALRAIAILLVIMAHSVLSYGAPNYIAPLQLGGIGVDLFFLLSGWLLGRQLFLEQIKNGKIDVLRFWIRRWMRTLPAYYVVLIALILQQYIVTENFTFPWAYVFFLQNYQNDVSFFSISWSLCVEEQFYLAIAPSLFFIGRWEPKKATLLLCILLVIPFFLRRVGLFNDGYSPTHLQLDCCIMGVLLAQINTQRHELWQTLIKFVNPAAFISTLLFVGFFVARYYPELGISKIDNLILTFIFGSWVVLANKNQYWQGVLSFPFANYIATRSYGMYLLHPEILALQKKFMLTQPFFFYFVISVIGSVVLAEILYRIIEKPFMDMREQFSFSR